MELFALFHAQWTVCDDSLASVYWCHHCIPLTASVNSVDTQIFGRWRYGSSDTRISNHSEDETLIEKISACVISKSCSAFCELTNCAQQWYHTVIIAGAGNTFAVHLTIMSRVVVPIASKSARNSSWQNSTTWTVSWHSKVNCLSFTTVLSGIIAIQVN